MRQELLAYLQKITPEEQAILEVGDGIRQELYTSRREFVVDSRRLLEKGKLIEIRPHTRFARFPRHRHNYVEMVYQCTGGSSHVVDHAGGRESLTLRPGDLLFLNQNVAHEILPTGAEDLAVNFIILPQFFSRPISMIERENVLRDFLLATLSGAVDGSGWLHVRARGLVPVENLLEGMIWTLVDGRAGTNTVLEASMGLLFMNLSMYADVVGRSGSGGDGQSLVFAALKYIEDRYSDGTLAQLSRELDRPDAPAVHRPEIVRAVGGQGLPGDADFRPGSVQRPLGHPAGGGRGEGGLRLPLPGEPGDGGGAVLLLIGEAGASLPLPVQTAGPSASGISGRGADQRNPQFFLRGGVKTVNILRSLHRRRVHGTRGVPENGPASAAAWA